jgi:hypothetical protein
MEIITMERAYEKFLLTAEEELSNRQDIEIADITDKSEHIGGGVMKFTPELPEGLTPLNYRSQHDIFEACYQTAVNIMQLENVEITTGGNYMGFDIILSEKDNIQDCYCSPKLSRVKLIAASNKEVSDVVIDLLLDRDSWLELGGIRGKSLVLSDGNGNWISHNKNENDD